VLHLSVNDLEQALICFRRSIWWDGASPKAHAAVLNIVHNVKRSECCFVLNRFTSKASPEVRHVACRKASGRGCKPVGAGASQCACRCPPALVQARDPLERERERERAVRVQVCARRR
jgi:hypothetical protein